MDITSDQCADQATILEDDNDGMPVGDVLPADCNDTVSGNEQDGTEGDGEVETGDDIQHKQWCGFKIVGDNINKRVKPKQMTEDCQTRMLNYFHVYAVRDRVDCSHLTDKLQTDMQSPIDSHALLPSGDDLSAMKSNIAELVARVLCKRIPFLQNFKHVISWHIEHEHASEMSKKSEVVGI